MIPLPDCPILRVDGRTPPSVARDLQRRAGADVLRLLPGAYVSRADWARLDGAGRHLTRMLAVLPGLDRSEVLTHESALLLHGLRLLGPWPDAVRVGAPGRTGADHRSRSLDRLPVPPGAVTTVTLGPHRLKVLGLDGTAAALARSLPFRDAVVALDQLLGIGARRERVEALVADGPSRCRRRAQDAVDFADPASDSVGESAARVALHDAGAPQPVLQQRFRSPDGRVARVDFWFPDQGVVVEFDGETKYRDPALRGGRRAEDVVVAEKHREDWIRALPRVCGFVRLRTRDVRQVDVVAARLRSAGIPLHP